jgi:hypothetical protein
MGPHVTYNGCYNAEFFKLLKYRIYVQLYKIFDIYDVLVCGRVQIASK